MHSVLPGVRNFLIATIAGLALWPLPAWLFVILYAVIELMLGVTGTEAGVAHFAHLGGMIGGYIVIRHWRRRGRLK